MVLTVAKMRRIVVDTKRLVSFREFDRSKLLPIGSQWTFSTSSTKTLDGPTPFESVGLNRKRFLSIFLRNDFAFFLSFSFSPISTSGRIKQLPLISHLSFLLSSFFNYRGWNRSFFFNQQAERPFPFISMLAAFTLFYFILKEISRFRWEGDNEFSLPFCQSLPTFC